MITDARRLREARRPAECTGDPRCWVEIGAPGTQASGDNRGPRCLACNGKIRFLHDDLDPVFIAPTGISATRWWLRFPITSHKPGR